MNDFRLSFPSSGWLKVSWKTPDAVEGLLPRLEALLEIPGIRLNPLAFEAPRSTWALPDVASMIEVFAGCAELDHGGFLVHTALWEPKQPLYEHQKVAALQALNQGSLFLCDEMGLGKTRTAIVAAETFARMHGPTRARLIIAPKFVRATWRNELFALGAIEDESEFCALESRDLNHPSWNKDAKWYFCHYDVISVWATKLGIRRPVAVIADESHWLKNPKAKRSKGAFLAAAPAPFRMLLTGTPMANRPAELYQPLSILSGPSSWGTNFSFRLRYCGAMHDGYGYVDNGPTNVEELKTRLDGVYLRRTLDTVGLDLPKRSRQTIDCDLDAHARKQHDKVLDGVDIRDLARAVIEGRAGEETLGLIAHLRKVTSDAKLETTVDYVKSAFEQGESVVVFTWERRVAEKLAQKLDFSCYVVHGGFPQEDRDKAVEDFQASGGVLIATLDSLKEGVTLHKARLVVIHDLHWVPSTILQSEARVHRIGQTRPVISTWVVAKDTIDTLLARALIAKAEVMNRMLGIGEAEKMVDELDLSTAVGAQDFASDFTDIISQWRTT